MARDLTSVEFARLLEKAQYAIVDQGIGVYKIVDNYISDNYFDPTWALVNMDDEEDVILLDEYLDNPFASIKYDKVYGVPTFSLGGDINANDIDITLLTPITL